MYFNEKHNQRVINRGDNYTYICSYKLNEITIDKKKSKMHIRVKCPYCGKKYDVRLDQFDNGSKCSYCCNEYENSFAYHIEVELGERLEDYWDFEENSRLGINPWDIYKSSTDKIYIWCQDKWHHGSYRTTANKFTSKGTRCGFCTNIKVHPKDSFGQWLIDTYGDNAIEKYWSPKNTLDPFTIARGSSSTQVWILCQEKDYHNDFGGYKISPANFIIGKRCSYCKGKRVHPKDSFAQWGIDTFGDNFLEKYWSNKNNELGIDPWKIKTGSNNEIYIYCQKHDYHNDDGGYVTTSVNFVNGNRCSYCNPFASHKVHTKDSFGALYPSKAKHWSEKNDKSPFKVAPKSGDKYKFICQECGEEFERDLAHLNRSNSGVYCINCNNSQLEEITKIILQKYNIEYKSQVKYDGLIGLGNGNLSYDFYLPDYNLLIECQGEQHEHYCKGFHKTKAYFERQLEHDRRKKQYSIDHNINFLEIWYYDIDNIEQILTKQLNL